MGRMGKRLGGWMDSEWIYDIWMEEREKIRENVVTKQGEGKAPGQKECGPHLTAGHTL